MQISKVFYGCIAGVRAFQAKKKMNNINDLAEMVKQTVNSYACREGPVDVNIPLSSYGLDSLDAAEMGFELEKRLNIRSDDVINMSLKETTTTQDIINKIKTLKNR